MRSLNQLVLLLEKLLDYQNSYLIRVDWQWFLPDNSSLKVEALTWNSNHNVNGLHQQIVIPHHSDAYIEILWLVLWILFMLHQSHAHSKPVRKTQIKTQREKLQKIFWNILCSFRTLWLTITKNKFFKDHKTSVTPFWVRPTVHWAYSRKGYLARYYIKAGLTIETRGTNKHNQPDKHLLTRATNLN